MSAASSQISRRLQLSPQAQDSPNDSVEDSSGESSGSGSGSESSRVERRKRKLHVNVFSWPNYNSLLRIRMAYGVGTLFAGVVSITLGASLQVFFSAIDAEAQSTAISKTSIKGFVVIVLTPVCLLLIAALADEMLDLCIDALDTPPLSNFRAMVLLYGVPGSVLDWTIVTMMEVIPIMFVICMLFHGVELQFSNISAGYVEGTQLCCLILSFVQLVVHASSIWAGKAQEAEVLANRIDLHNVIIGETHQVEKLKRTDLEDQRVPRNVKLVRAHTGEDHRITPLFASIAFVVVLAVLLCFWSLANNGIIGFASALIVMVLCLVILSRFASRMFPGLLGWTFNFLIGLFIFIAVGLMVFSASGVMDVEVRQEVPNIFEPPESISPYAPIVTGNRRYPICYMSWGNRSMPEKHRLSVLDMAVFADAVYYSYIDEVAMLVNNATNGTDLEGVKIDYLADPELLGRWGVFTLRNSGVRVFAIRGTTSKQDTMADADMYAAVQVLQFFNQFLPVLSLYPTSFTRMLLGHFAVHRWIGDRALWRDVVAEACKWRRKSAREGLDLVITGHSLGGALAAIAGAWCGAQVVAYSPPGQMYSAFRFGITELQYIEKTTTVVQPRNDLVPQVDKQVGFTQYIECKATSIQCHSITRTACELYRSCGDPRGRSMEENCRVQDEGLR